MAYTPLYTHDRFMSAFAVLAFARDLTAELAMKEKPERPIDSTMPNAATDAEREQVMREIAQDGERNTNLRRASTVTYTDLSEYYLGVPVRDPFVAISAAEDDAFRTYVEICRQHLAPAINMVLENKLTIEALQERISEKQRTGTGSVRFETPVLTAVNQMMPIKTA